MFQLLKKIFFCLLLVASASNSFAAVCTVTVPSSVDFGTLASRGTYSNFPYVPFDITLSCDTTNVATTVKVGTYGTMGGYAHQYVDVGVVGATHLYASLTSAATTSSRVGTSTVAINSGATGTATVNYFLHPWQCSTTPSGTSVPCPAGNYSNITTVVLTY
ncbi:hypothetical protein [Geotalea sp. SG265]|uniref:hypothetical protein n=1 Tax=Geotalea sp. SG265 TaxID=2922867 RepID=UPI001FB00E31|nr:hypothetical protein [Geotalea sp. SG265]